MCYISVTATVVLCSKFLPTDTEGPGSIPGTGPLSLVRITEELPEGKSGSGLEKPGLRAVGIRCAAHATLL
jgi:hypothetical protein